MKYRILIIPSGALFFISFAIAIFVSAIAFYLLMLSAEAWKVYAMRGGRMPASLTEAAIKLGIATDTK